MEAGKLIRWQPPMRRVLIGLVPVVLSSIYFFGWRVVLMLAVANAAAFFAEYAFTKGWKEPVTSAVFVTGSLFVLSLPPTLPIWMAVVGVVFAVVFGKMVFGGFGRNIFNPALTGRAFIYVCFAGPMTTQWFEPVGGTLGGFARYAPDAVTQATPGMLLKTGADFSLWDLYMGATPGVVGGTNVWLVLIGGLYIVLTRAANYRIVVSGVAGYLAMQTILWAAGVSAAADPLRAMAAGSFVIGIFFYATDPVSASQTNLGRWIYGAFVGIMSSLIAVFSVWPAGTMFAILLGNMFAPIVDYTIRRVQAGGAPA